MSYKTHNLPFQVRIQIKDNKKMYYIFILNVKLYLFLFVVLWYIIWIQLMLWIIFEIAGTHFKIRLNEMTKYTEQ